ncbi:hypothetical protein FGADI_4600 [Fusarium gaditjirri]|uniref:Uncharacterized protein n=1 Tax=Fusarium gaditjirri TaxID=282569 RepID=A0A8H4TCJ2_9HYPO|nr:hypothetical protein FGADI_4600 [Fusarium gaditjirri]
MAPFSLYQLSNASRRLSSNLLRRHGNTLAVSRQQPNPIRLLSLQQPRFLHTGDHAKSDQSTQINSDIAAEEGINAYSSVETSNEAMPTVDTSTQTTSDVVVEDHTKLDSSHETSDDVAPIKDDSTRADNDATINGSTIVVTSAESNNDAVPVADDSVKSTNNITRDQNTGDSNAPNLVLPILSSDPRDEPKVKGRPWTEEELAQLEEFIKRPMFSIDYIAIRMDRSPFSVRSQLTQIQEQKGIDILRRNRRRTPWQHPRDATPEQVATFEAKQDEVQQRMQHIVETLMTLPKTDQWEEILKLRSASEWTSAIMKLIPLRTWHILAADQPPTKADYMTIKMVDLDNMAGVFASVDQHKVYIGLAEPPFGALAKFFHQQDGTETKPEGVHIGFIAPLIPVSVLGSKQLTYEEKVDQKHVLGLARAALAAWLGANNRNASPSLRRLYAWTDIESSEVHPFGRNPCNPLEQRLRLPSTPAETAAKASLAEAWKRKPRGTGKTEKELKRSGTLTPF